MTGWLHGHSRYSVMTVRQWIRVLLVPALMFVVAGFFLWQGIRILAHPSASVPAWIGWLCLAVAALKASLWSVVTIGFVRHPEAVRAARHWNRSRDRG